MDLPATYARTYRITLPAGAGGGAAAASASSSSSSSSPSRSSVAANGRSLSFSSAAGFPSSPGASARPASPSSSSSPSPAPRKNSEREPLPFPLPALPRVPESTSRDDENDDGERASASGPPTPGRPYFLSPNTDAMTEVSAADSALDLHAEIAQAVQRAVSAHNASWQSTLAAAEEEWEKSREEEVARVRARLEEQLARERKQWDGERRELTVVRDEQLAKMGEELARARAEREEEVGRSRQLSAALEKLRAESVPLSSHRAAVLGLELKLKAREKATEEAVRAMKSTQENAVGRAAVLVRMSEDRLLVALSAREAELKDTVEKLEKEYRSEVEKVRGREKAREQTREREWWWWWRDERSCPPPSHTPP